VNLLNGPANCALRAEIQRKWSIWTVSKKNRLAMKKFNPNEAFLFDQTPRYSAFT
jgi:hypothetical protein